MDAKTRQNLLYAAALLSLLAALIHLWVMPQHFAEWWGYGLFFLIAAAAQALFAVIIVCAPSVNLLRAGIALWLFTRTIGIPVFGPHDGEIEEIGQIDVISKIVEALLVGLLVLLLRTESQPPPRPTSSAL